MYAERLRESLPRVRERMESASRRAGRDGNVDLVAVTKGHPVAAVRAALEAGLPICGENRVDELEAKVSEVGRRAVKWHLIGHLQRNKVRPAIPLFDLLHSLDSLRLGRELSAEAVRCGVEVESLLQVNTSGEDTKGGFRADAVERAAELVALPGLRLVGVMTMAPLTDDEATIRATFAAARRVFQRCGEVPGFEMRHLSMGMSNDFEIAIEEGSTMVRLGTVLFGERRR
jgi:PLP dependent protein